MSEQADQFQRSLALVKTTMMMVETSEKDDIDGYSEEGITYKMNAGKYEEGEMSADGKVYEVAATNNNSGTVTINVFGYSTSRDAIYKAKTALIGKDKVDFVTVDTINKRRHSAVNCTLKESFEIKEGKKRGQIAFVFQSPHIRLDEKI